MATDRTEGLYSALSHEYWWHALSGEVDAVWGQIPWIDEEELKHIAQCLAMTAYIESDPAALEHRRLIQEAYMKGTFSDQTAQRYRRLMSYGSNVQKVLRNVCTLYNRAPERTFSKEDAVQQALTGAYTEMRTDVRLQQAYKVAKVTNHVAIRPRFTSNGRRTARILTPAQYRLRPSEEFPDEAEQMWIPNFSRPGRSMDGRMGRDIRFTAWTDTHVWYADHRGRPIYPDGTPAASEDQVWRDNIYGRIPYTFLRLSDPIAGPIYGSGWWDLIGLQVWNNTTKFVNDRNFIYTSYAILIATNMKYQQRKFDMTPGNVVDVEGIYQPTGVTGALLEPDIKSVGQESSFTEGDDFRIERLKEFFRDNGLPSYYYDESGQPPSGEALKVQERELHRITDEDRHALTEGEADLAELSAIVHNRDRWGDAGPDQEPEWKPLVGAQALPERLPDFSIDYGEEPYYIKPDEDYTLGKKQMNDGIMRPKTFYKKFSGVDAIRSDDEAVEAMRANKEKIEGLGGTASSVTDTVGGAGQVTKLVADYEAGIVSRLGALAIAQVVFKLPADEANSLFVEGARRNLPTASGAGPTPPDEEGGTE